MAVASADWDPARYGAFRDLRLRPALDLLAQVPDLPPGEMVDLGCGAGAVGESLTRRFPGHELIGVDGSAAMLDQARGSGRYARLDLADIAGWQPETPPALIFSNAALNWLDRHDRLLPQLAGSLAPGGVFAVQMPRQFAAPSHSLLQTLADQLFPDRFPPAAAPVHEAETYVRLLSPFGRVNAWTTTYIQRLDPVAQGHPVRAFTESTAMRPYLARLSEAEAEAYLSAYDAALAPHYPALPSGEVLFPFTRVFLVLERS